MGAFLAGLGGAGEGLEKGANLGGGLYIKGNIEAEHQRLAQEATAKREERNIALKAAADKDLELTRPRTIAPGSTLRTPGQSDFTAPDTRHPQELLSYYSAQANRLNAEADAIRRDAKYKGQKPTLPSIRVEKDDNGNVYNVDQNSGAIGTIVPGAPATEGKSRWFSADEPARPAQPHRIVWQLNGQTLPNGLGDIYPDIQGRTPTNLQGGSAGASDSRPPLSTFFGAQKPTSQAPAGASTYRAPTPTTDAPSAAPETNSAGRDLDAARTRVADARAKFQSYGTLQRKRDPEGFNAAQEELNKAQRAEEEALSNWQMGVGFQRALPLRAK